MTPCSAVWTASKPSPPQALSSRVAVPEPRSMGLLRALFADVLVLLTVGTCAVRVTRVHRYVSASRLCRGVSRVRPTRPTL